MTVFDWKIQLLERDIQPADMDGAVVIAHWRCDGAEESEGVTYSSSSYGTCGFSPDPTAPGYIPYADLTQTRSWAGAGLTVLTRTLQRQDCRPVLICR
jgi:hypothetical protein